MVAKAWILFMLIAQSIAFAPPSCPAGFVGAAMQRRSISQKVSFIKRLSSYPWVHKTAQYHASGWMCKVEGSSAFSVKPSPVPLGLGWLFGGAKDFGKQQEEIRGALKRKLREAVSMKQGRKSRETVESLLEELVNLDKKSVLSHHIPGIGTGLHFARL